MLSSSSVIQNSTISNNTATSTLSGSGGGGINGGTLTITNSVVSGNFNNFAPDILGNNDFPNVNYSAIGNLKNATLSLSSGNNLPFGTNVLLVPLTDNGGPTKTMLPQSGSPLINAGSNALIPAGITTDQRGGSFVRSSGVAVDIGAVEIPFPPVASAVAANITTPGATSYTFTVSYFADAGISAATVIGNNSAVRITGPKGFTTLANYIKINNSTDGTPRTATYSFAPPGGSWDGPDTGTYTISIEPNAVTDVNGLVVAPGPITTFTVALRQTFIVTNTNDSGPGSLRQAVLDANDAPPQDIVAFDPSVTGIINLTGGTITVTSPVIILGPGAALLTLQRDPGAPKAPIINASARLDVSDLTITGGQNDSDGGAIFLTAQGVFTGVVLTGNTSGGKGGAIYLNSPAANLGLHNTLVSGNTAVAGGAIYSVAGSGTISIDSSTISNNSDSAIVVASAGRVAVTGSTLNNNSSTGFGGALSILQVTNVPTIYNSTITANTAATSGGGIYVAAGGLEVRNSDIIGNTANGSTSGTGGGGIYLNSSSPLTIANSIVIANNNANYPDIRNAGQSNVNYSAVGPPTGFTLSATSANNLPAGTDLKLGPLADNGGFSPTMMPDIASPLINAGSNAAAPQGFPNDQRDQGFARISGAAVDIGAVEVDAIPPALQRAQFNSFANFQNLNLNFTEIITLEISAIELLNLTTNQIIPTDKMALTYQSNTVLVTFPGYSHGALPDGDYRGFIHKDGIQDYSHNHAMTDLVVSFSFLLGDLNEDRTVSIADYITLASNFGTTGALYFQGDMNYDGTISIADFIDMGRAFGNELGTPPPAVPQPAAEVSISSETPFTRTRHIHRRHVKHHPRPHLLFRFERR
jgi:hypothetical protein